MKPRQIRISILSLLIVVAFSFWWFKTPPPLVGGGVEDGLLASWVKKRTYATVAPLEERGFQRLTAENANGWYSISREPIQTFDFYRSYNPPRPTATRRTLVLQPIGPITAEQNKLLLQLKEFAKAFFQLPVRIAAPLPLPTSEVWIRVKGEPKRQAIGSFQYEAGHILEKVLLPHLPDDAAAYIGITMADLWASDLSFVFGLGSSEARVGVYSLVRYFPAANRPLTQLERTQGLRRSCLILDHEVGHMFGLMHCVLYKCAMNGANSLGDADNTPLDYCPICHRKLLWNMGCDGTKRYRDLLAFYRKYGLEKEAVWTQGRLRNWEQIGP